MQVGDVVPLAALAVLLTIAYRHPRGSIELLGGLLAAGVTLWSGALTGHQTATELDRLAPVVGFLAAILVVADQCRAEGLFAAIGSRLAGRPPAVLFVLVFAAAVVVTVTLSLDATVVLLTPVVVVATAGSVVGEVACVRLANSASLLLPVANLTNLLAMPRLGLTFGGFVLRMAPAWLVVLALEYVVLGRLARRERLRPAPQLPAEQAAGAPLPVPRFPTAVVALMLVGFVVSSPYGVHPVWVALAAALVLAGRGLAARRTDAVRLLHSAHLPFAVFVLCLGVVVAALGSGWLGDLVAHAVPSGPHRGDLAALLLVAALGGVLANLVNNLPATLLLVPLCAPLGTTALLSLLVGINLGASMTWTGSLANLLWRRTLRASGRPVPGRAFHLAGAATSPAAIVLAVVVLDGWSSLLGN
ncbi:MAG: SLC13 family permease [Marmoricola sp.]